MQQTTLHAAAEPERSIPLDMKEKYVTAAELTTTRTPAELHTWLDAKFAMIASRAGGKHAVRMREGLCKELVEEVYALSIYAKHRWPESSNVALTPVLGNQNYDVIVCDYENPNAERRLEITQAHQGEPEYLRRVMLGQQGYAPAHGQIQKTGTKKTGIKLQAKLVAQSLEALVEERLKLITEAFDRKAEKNYEPRTELVIVFEDVVAFDLDDERKLLYELVEKDFGPRIDPFCAVALVSWSGRIYVRFTPDK